MKSKNILLTALVSMTVAGVATSCEDLLEVDSKMVMYDDQNTLDHATDTVYSVMGIISKMQKIADRSVLLNELRGDLVALTDQAGKDLKNVYQFNFDDLDNNSTLNSPADYYAVINNCNFFLANADTSFYRNAKNVFIKEYVAVLSFRAWTYLQLAQVYGEVLFVDEPILSSDITEKKTFSKLNIKQLADTLLKDFDDSFVTMALPDYGSLGGETNGDGSTSATHASKSLFIPVRVIMGDLYLWSENYPMAVKMYYDFLTQDGSERPTTTASVNWFDNKFVNLDDADDSYSGQFSDDNFPISYIPMESDDYNGLTSELPNVFNSTKDNNYWYQATRSNAVTGLSSRQNYCYRVIDKSSGGRIQKRAYLTNKEAQFNILRRGDLRLQSVLKTKTVNTDNDIANLNSNRQTLAKINAEKICIYRNDVIYLRLAEALNRCNLPKTAFTILKTGFCNDVVDIAEIPQCEVDRAQACGIDYIYDIKSYFQKGVMDAKDDSRVFDGITYSMYYSYWSNTDVYNTIGIHSRGSGDAYFDTTYVIPRTIATLADSVLFVEDAIVDEMAMETCFEGYRFGDLMRIAMHRAPAGGFADNAYLAKKVADREQLAPTDGEPVSSLYLDLKGDGSSLNSKWFLSFER